MLQKQSVSASPSCFTAAIFSFFDKIQVFVYLFRLLSFSLSGSLEQQNTSDDKFFFFLWINTKFYF